MKKHILIPLAVILLSVIGCVTPEEGGNDNPQPPTPSQEQITIPSTVDVSPVVTPEGGDTKISFTATAAWTASVISTKADSWVDVNPKSGDPGPAEIKITTTPNDTYVERNATIQIKCGNETKDIVLTQKQQDNITVTTDKVELGVEGGTFTIELKTNVDFSYEIDGDWIKYVSTKAYTDKTLTFSADANDGVQKREGSVTVKGGEFSETVKVYQSGEEPTLIITQNAYSLEAEGGNITVEISSNVAVTMTIPENVIWITENKTKSVSTSTFHLDVAANETKEARSSEITFSNEESGLSEKITVNQKGKIYVPVTDMVDLGLSVKWATCNVGASKPEEYGGYYQWAGTQDVTSTSIYLYWDNFPYHTGSEPQRGYTKYIPSEIYWYWSGTGSPDDKTMLDLNDDIAHVTLGGSWRMPTKNEFEELKNNCTGTWTKDFNGTGVAGLIVTSNVSGYTDKCIFLPAAGWRTDDYLTAMDYGYYWTSSLDIDGPQSASGACFNFAGWNRDKNWNVSSRYKGHSVRPVYADGGKIRVTGVSLDPTNIELNTGETSTLNATVTPSYATDKSISWTSSDTGVATVDQSGKVTAVKAGSATITVTTTDGGHTATCSVTVKSSEPAVPEMVDLGLSVKWATCNVGASKPEEYGGYFQWAGIQDVSSTSIYLSWDNCPYHIGSDPETGWTKYVPSNMTSYWSGSGNPDNKTVLDPEDDVAHVKLGGNWRMPTYVEWIELDDNCTWTWTDDYNGTGVAGIKLTSKKNGNSIFLPFSGLRNGGYLYNAGSEGRYWSLSVDTFDTPDYALGLYFHSGGVSTYGGSRYDGYPVRPVYGDRESVTRVSLDPTSLNLNVGETYTLSATVTPSNATEKGISWTSSDTSVATVDQSGKVTAFKAGSATITVKTTDGGYTASCSVTVKGSEPEVPGAIDLGLSVKWATCNVGASRPEEHGGYYQWGGLIDVTNTNTYLDWNNCPFHTGYDRETGWTKYVWLVESSFWSGYGSPDNKTVLDPGDDVAHVMLGGKWRMPTRAELDELIDKCKWSWTDNYHGTGVPGAIMTSKVTGYTDKSIFLPATGYRIGDHIYTEVLEGIYWSSSLDLSNPAAANDFEFGKGHYVNFISGRFLGQLVRPVYGDRVRVTGIRLDQSSISLNIGGKHTLYETISPSNAAEQSVSWTSSNTDVATVNQNGAVRAVASGHATITVRTTDGGHTATCSVTVKNSDNPPTPGNSLVGTCWTCSFSDEAKYNTIYVDITLTFDSQSTFVMTTDETNVEKEHYIDLNGDGIIDQYDEYVEGGTYHNSYTENGTYKVDGSTLELFSSGWYEPIYGTISGNIITLYGDEDIVFRKK